MWPQPRPVSRPDGSSAAVEAVEAATRTKEEEEGSRAL